MAPPVTWDSTTTTTSARAAMIRLRAGKHQGAGGLPKGYSLSNRPRSATARQSRAVVTRVDAIEPGADNADRRGPVNGQHTRMGRSVDPQRETGHHRHPRIGQIAAHGVGHVDPVAAGVTGADDGRTAAGEMVGIAAPEQHRRRVVVGLEDGREGGGPEHRHPHAGSPMGRPDLGGIDAIGGSRPATQDDPRVAGADHQVRADGAVADRGPRPFGAVRRDHRPQPRRLDAGKRGQCDDEGFAREGHLSWPDARRGRWARCAGAARRPRARPRAGRRPRPGRRW